ncbi:HAMP domain-containing protein [Candidatus Binatia bacterium]|nr:HAMP domain-containing protein [Candidatus Binatia bacterium]
MSQTSDMVHPAMRRLHWPGVRSVYGQLLALSLLLVVVPGVVFAWVALGNARSALEQAVGRQLAEVAQDAAEHVETELSRAETLLRGWARRLPRSALAAHDVGELGRTLTSLQREDASVRSVAIVDLQGRELAHGTQRPRLAAASGSWREAVARGETVLVALPTDPSEAVFAIATPIADDAGRGLAGVLIAEYPWDPIDGTLQHAQHDLAVLGLAVSILVLDRSGRVVGDGAWQEPLGLTGRDLVGDGWTAPALAIEKARASYVRETAADALVGYASVEPSRLGLVALAVQPIADAVEPVRRLQRRLASALAVVLIAGLALAALLAARIGRPIRELTAATRELARTGTTSHRVVTSSHDEIGELARSFNRMAADLTRARDDLLAASRMALLGELAAGMAHEIRTPLGIVRSSAQLLGRRIGDGDARNSEMIDMIVSEADRLDRVVGGLLEIARPHEPVLESVRLGPVLARAVDLLATQAEERGITLRRPLGPDRPAQCDPEQIYQVALNLLMNALQNVPRGGTVDVRTIAYDGRVGFEVADDGPGIPRDIQESIFTPFFTRRPGGTGLGLALVQRIVATHHGSVSVASEVGHGATFRVELPAAEAMP